MKPCQDGVSAFLCGFLGRILEHVHGEEDVGMAPLINPQNLPRVVSTLLESTRDEPHIAEQICYALSQLAAGFKDSDTSLFSPYFADIVQALLQQVSDTAFAVVQVMQSILTLHRTASCSDRKQSTSVPLHFASSASAGPAAASPCFPCQQLCLCWSDCLTCFGVLQGERALQMDVQEGARLQLQAFEAINEVVRSASSDTLPLVGQLIQALLEKLASTFRMQIASSEAREHQNDLQVRFALGLLCLASTSTLEMVVHNAYKPSVNLHVCTAVTH